MEAAEENFAGQTNAEREMLKRLLEKKPEPNSRKIKTDKICSWCGEEIEDNHYYVCEFHKKVFCDNCAHNFYKREINFHLAPKCDEKDKINTTCIWKKVIIEN